MTPRPSRLLCLGLAAMPFLALGQENGFSCTANDPDLMVELHHNDPHRLQEMQQAEAQLEAFTQGFTAAERGGGQGYVIPVVFHIIHDNGQENISDDQIIDEMRILNEDFNKQNPEWPNVRPAFLDLVADVGVTFRLAQLDPNGNCTKGITRTQSPLTNDGTQTMKDLIQWPRDRYLNVWVAASADGAAGYAMYPGSVASSWAAGADGIVILHSYVGSIGTSNAGRSHALSHEVGHWINLAHCWGSTNDPGVSCDGDDGVADTPQTIGWDHCDLNGATCGSTLDNVENFMEYAYCQKMFTNGQKARMLAALNSSTAGRNNLWTDQNLALTGVNLAPALCAVEIMSNVRQICAGSTVHFSDMSYNGVTQRNWVFVGGLPDASDQEDPVVTYPQPGLYPVTLTASNGVESITHTENNYILVLPSTGLPTPWSEGFEAVSALPSTDWMVNNPDGDVNTFSLRTDAAYSGTHSVRLKNSGTFTGRIDELISNTIDLSATNTPLLTFRHAFARRMASNNDLLRVYLSNNCGATWSLRYVLHGQSDLPTVPNQAGSFTPSSPTQWAYNEIDNIGPELQVSDFRIKFWFQGDGGNDLWLDDININGMAVGFSDVGDQGDLDVRVVPNPTSDDAQLLVTLPEAGAVRAELLDPTGRVVQVIDDGRRAAGAQRWTLPVAGLRSGLYLVRIQFGEQRRVVRFTKS
ncbi:MAG: T9SS type A sorting domain-containing protein [Bacteroidetes bacterium]|nr:T9SS type A sorting domain-containing protein [Bacteroidota bacterium]